MLITDYSILASVVCFNIFIILIILFRNNNYFISLFGIKFMLIISAVCVLRLLFAVEFPFAKVIYSDKIFVTISDWLRIDYNVLGYTVTVYDTIIALIIVFTLFGVILFVLQMIKYFRLINSMYNLPSSASAKTIEVYNKVLAETKLKRYPKIIQNIAITTPCTTGYFHPIIMIPEYPFSDTELYYILKHELTHYINKDIIIKLIFSFINCLFWWNPFVFLLRSEINQILEIKCDWAVCEKMPEVERLLYLRAITNVLRNMVEREFGGNYYTSAIALTKGDKLVQRFSLICETPIKARSLTFNICTYCALAALVVLSYSFLIQRYSYPAETDFSDCIEDTNIIICTPENSEIYLENDKYKLYANGEFQFDVGEDALKDFQNQGFIIHINDN